MALPKILSYLLQVAVNNTIMSSVITIRRYCSVVFFLIAYWRVLYLTLTALLTGTFFLDKRQVHLKRNYLYYGDRYYLLKLEAQSLVHPITT